MHYTLTCTQRSPPFNKKGWGTDLPTIALRLAAEPKKSGTRARVVVFTQVRCAVFVVCYWWWCD